MLDKIKEGYDVVYATRQSRKSFVDGFGRDMD
jgi:hypothetical protein